MLLDICNIHKTYGIPGSPSERKVFEGLSLSVGQGETVAITGPSGSGKTTLLNLVAALDRPDSGQILFDGQDIVTFTGARLDRYRRESIGMVFQLHHLLPQLTLMENVLLPVLAGSRKVPAAVAGRGEELVRRLGLWETRHQRPGELSGGECQRAAVARALINNPQLLLADEPTGALDESNAHNLVSLLLEVTREQGKTLILVTHSSEVAERMGRRVSLR